MCFASKRRLPATQSAPSTHVYSRECLLQPVQIGAPGSEITRATRKPSLLKPKFRIVYYITVLGPPPAPTQIAWRSPSLRCHASNSREARTNRHPPVVFQPLKIRVGVSCNRSIESRKYHLRRLYPRAKTIRSGRLTDPVIMTMYRVANYSFHRVASVRAHCWPICKMASQPRMCHPLSKFRATRFVVMFDLAARRDVLTTT
ncbi:hypothetical protein BD779DRAFT_1791883 [Infundibulicybe gibba]|nr:hypothetical protein BD779DRAFT_1791883 [Infundibulicybe gibba]